MSDDVGWLSSLPQPGQLWQMPGSKRQPGYKKSNSREHGVVLKDNISYIYAYFPSYPACPFLSLLTLTLALALKAFFLRDFTITTSKHPLIVSYIMASIKCPGIGPGCPPDGSPLGYAPNMAASIIFLALFGVSLAAHITLGWKYKTWTFLIAMALGSITECVGYLGRILMHNNPYKLSTLVFISQT